MFASYVSGLIQLGATKMYRQCPLVADGYLHLVMSFLASMSNGGEISKIEQKTMDNLTCVSLLSGPTQESRKKGCEKQALPSASRKGPDLLQMDAQKSNDATYCIRYGRLHQRVSLHILISNKL
ncbi:hypothetical protein Ae201684P_004099 [Aphanomyces euteiches]|nr:hypothetical protein Ae201684P_020242 [Aphanomyces euteiches]KAH9075285.1 hypothetical protein Ae201684P_003967 [Aphanomyces euteiches]KAH9075419.1 hypothetical protein Ae201684P_004099 [Aphanomyces euteiches]